MSISLPKAKMEDNMLMFFFCFQFRSVAQSCLTLCNPMDCRTLGLAVRHRLPEFTQTHVHLL